LELHNSEWLHRLRLRLSTARPPPRPIARRRPVTQPQRPLLQDLQVEEAAGAQNSAEPFVLGSRIK
ncbi:MAG: hypothetical protein AAFQ95_23120, partial [Cyanobacteria bacterium J06621_3]